MQQHSDGDSQRIARAVDAADQVFNSEPGSPSPSYEPSDTQEARAAVQRLRERFQGLAGSVREALDAARSSGTLLSSDRLQGLAEIVQNADDVKASEVRFLLGPTDLLASHDGAPVHLRDVLALAMPWLTTKASDAASIGRFGVGLSTLRSLSTTLEVHCAPYHVRIGDPTVAPVDPLDLAAGFGETGWTTLRIPLQDGTLQSSQLEAWLDRWNDSALLFLRHVVRVTLLDPNGDPIRQLALSRRRNEDLVSGSKLAAISREFADTGDGRSWAVYSDDFPTPGGVSRARKATGSTTPVAVALPLDPAKTDPDGATRRPGPNVAAALQLGPAEAGQIHAGLPVAPMRWPLFANAQFDPLASRESLAPTAWNEALVKLVAELWSEAVLDLFGRDPQAAWRAMPLPCAGEGKAAGVIGALEAAVLEKARQAVASRLSFPVPGQGHISLSQLAVVAQPLEGILQEAEIAQLADVSATLPIDAISRLGP